MTENAVSRCLLCKNEIPPDADKCPQCGAPVERGSPAEQPAEVDTGQPQIESPPDARVAEQPTKVDTGESETESPQDAKAAEQPPKVNTGKPQIESPRDTKGLTDLSFTHCPLCGYELPPSVTRCTVCGTELQQFIEMKGRAEAARAPGKGDLLREEIPKVAVREERHICPLCATELAGEETKCPRCGIPIMAEETMVECSECGALVPAGSKSCLHCGMEIEEKPRPSPVQSPAVAAPVAPPPPPLEETVPSLAEAPPEIPQPPVPEKTRPSPVEAPQEISPPPQIPSRGLTNGRGAINGTRMTYGKGAINGTGIVNGTGITNGTGISAPRGARAGLRTPAIRRWQFLAILAAIVIVIPIFIFFAFSHPGGPAIDGKFGDWSDAEMFGMYVPASEPEITVQEWSVQNDGGSLYAYISVEGILMSTSNVDSFYVFVDSDDDPDTGYSVSGMGADYMLVLDGWEGEVRTASVMEYGSTTDLRDWNSWASYGSMTCSINSGKLEAKADLPVALGNDARYLLVSQTNSPDQDYSVSYPVPETGGLLIASLEPGISVNSNLGTVPAEANAVFAKLVLSCEGTSGTVTSMTPTVLGASMVSSFNEVSLTPGESKTFEIQVDTWPVPATNVVSVLLTENSFGSTFSDITILGDSVNAYVSSAPASIAIDGAFGDWQGRLNLDNDSELVENSNINMTATGFAGTTAVAAFYVSVEGEMFQGVYAPSAKAKPSGGGGGGGPVMPTRKSGEDVLRIFVDSDMSNATGQQVARYGKIIGAEYLIDIRGTHGKIVTKSLMAYDGSGWISIAGGVYAAKDMQRLELSVLTSSIGGSASIVTIIETTDWKDRSDWAWAGSALDPWVIDTYGNTYMSSDGSTWTYLGTPTLQPGDRIVDIALTMDGTDVFLVTNTGRTYYWTLGTSTSWTLGQNNSIDIATYSEAVSMAFYSRQNPSAWLLTKNGSYFWLMNAKKSQKEWTYQSPPLVGSTDYRDLVYANSTMYALRSGMNTRLNYSSNGNIWTDVTSPTGSTSNQTQFLFIPLTSGQSDDRLYVLCENGDIRYSSNGGQDWSALGDLPEPGVGNTSKYVALGIDPSGYMWAVTDTGYIYRSTDTTTYNSFVYTGKSPIGGIVAILPTNMIIPEFSILAVPVFATVFLVAALRTRLKRTRDA